MRPRHIAQIIGFAISGVALAIVLTQVDLNETVAVLARVKLGPLLIAIAALLVQFGALTIRWWQLLPASGGRRAPIRAVAEALLVGTLANAVLPARVGELVRAATVSRRGGVDFARSTGTVILERILDITVLAAVATVAAVALGAPPILVQPLVLVSVVGLVAIAIVCLGIGPPLMRRVSIFVRRRTHHPSVAAAVRWTARMVDGLHAGQRLGVIFLAIGLTTVSVVLDGLIIWAVAQSLDVELTWAQSLLMGTAGVLVTGIPSAPANVGTFELAVSWVGTLLGVPAADGFAVALLAHVVIVVPLSICGSIVLVLAIRRPKTPDPVDRLPIQATPG